MHLRRLRPDASAAPRDRHHELDARGVGSGRIVADEPRGKSPRVGRRDGCRRAKDNFDEYGVTAADENSDDDSPSHTESGHSLMQRASDIQFLRSLARRNGKLCRIACADEAGKRTGYFAKPKLDGDPVATLVLNDPEQWTVRTLDIHVDATREIG